MSSSIIVITRTIYADIYILILNIVLSETVSRNEFYQLTLALETKIPLIGI